MRSRHLVHEPDKARFVTATIVEWLPGAIPALLCDEWRQARAKRSFGDKRVSKLELGNEGGWGFFTDRFVLFVPFVVKKNPWP